ncbi:MAG: glycine cleavage system aminomethyltransferase GcvT, partial [Deltaproteobacteria bacterium]|nr:glycine cleavage system aminomethyltransferase GcvT [Deltaproteobacteria bacterium]
DGGVVDDIIVYCFGKERFLLCVNASNTDKVFEWMRENTLADVRNISHEYAQLALQGPASVEVLRPLCGVNPSEIKRYHFIVTKVCGMESIVSRTGYTGEDGFEIYFDPKAAAGVWSRIMESGMRYNIVPAGLGARDTLRLEMGYPLYGHELTDKTTPIEAGLDRFVALSKKADFIGKEALIRQASVGVKKTLIGLEMSDAGIPRQGYKVVSNGKEAGSVTSGTLSPSLRTGIGMAYVEPRLKAFGCALGIMIRDREAKARVAKTPFYVRRAEAKAR